MNDGGDWSVRNNQGLDELINGEVIVRFIKSRRLTWFGHLKTMPKENIPSEY